MKLKKENLKPTLVLGAICLIVALLMAVVNMVTAPKIEADTQAAIQESLSKVRPYGVEGEFIDVTESEIFKSKISGTTVTAVYQIEGTDIYAVTLSTSKGYTGNAILLTVSIGPGEDGKGEILGAVVTNNPESKDTGKTNSYFAGFANKDAFEIEAIGNDKPDLVAGVTYSTTAVRNAAYDAFKVLDYPVPKIEAAPRVENFTVWSGVGIAIAVLAIGGAVAYIIVKRRKGI